MTNPLQPAFDELQDILDDFEASGYQGTEAVFTRFVAALDREPVASLVTSLTPPVAFVPWYEAAKSTTGSMVGSGHLNWPVDRAERVSMMRELFRAIGNGEPGLWEVAHTFTYGGSGQFADDFEAFSRKIARPFLRDLSRLANLRADPPVLSEAVAQPFPPTGDLTLDGLLSSARDGFRDMDPSSRRDSLEKLWDAWERLKTIDASDKKLSVKALLDGVTTEPHFRQILETEARALTDIGNGFHIRHFETSKTELGHPALVEYLFHRLWAIIWLALATRAK